MAYLSLSTANLPDPAIDPAAGKEPADYFNTVMYEGNESTNVITGVGFQPDLVWTKRRNNTGGHRLVDSVRGVGKGLASHNTDAEYSEPNGVTSFDTDGFTLGNDDDYNKSAAATPVYVAWSWKANGSSVSNTDGSITSTVSANTTSGFSIVTYTGNATAGATIGHGLNSVPQVLICKNRSAARPWTVYTEMTGNAKSLELQSTGAAANSTAFNNTTPTSSVFTVSADGVTNGSSENIVCYAFHSVDGFSKFGTYDDLYFSDYDVDSPFIYTGFRPAFVMIKGTSSGREWVMYDNKRTPDNGVYLRANTSAAEQTDATNHDISFNANGFKIRGGSGDINTTNESYIYMAFADQPFKYANGGTE